MKLTAGEQLRLQRLVAQGNSAQMAAKILGHNIKDVRRYLLAAKKPIPLVVRLAPVPRPTPQIDYAHRDNIILPNQFHEGRPVIPETVIEERARRLNLAPRDLTAAIAGDPLPGYSALERR